VPHGVKPLTLGPRPRRLAVAVLGSLRKASGVARSS
jgi:hypothetical protein